MRSLPSVRQDDSLSPIDCDFARMQDLKDPYDSPTDYIPSRSRQPRRAIRRQDRHSSFSAVWLSDSNSDYDDYLDDEEDPLIELQRMAHDIVEEPQPLFDRDSELFQSPKVNSQEQQASDLRQRQESDGILWPFIQPGGELLYEKTAFCLFMIVFVVKETAFALIVFIDALFCAFIVNPFISFSQILGFNKDVSHVYPMRMLKGRPIRGIYRLFAVCILCSAVYLVRSYSKTHSVVPLDNINSNNTTYRGSSSSSPNTNTYRDHPTPMLDPNTQEKLLRQLLQDNEPLIQKIVLQQMENYLLHNDKSKQYIDEIIEKFNENAPEGVDSSRRFNYASATSGARYIPQYTSETFKPRKHGPLTTWLQQITSYFSKYEPSVLLALLPDNEPGQCWPMKGSNGTLGVHLSQPLYIHSVTIEHIAKQLGVSLSSAPKDIDIWGLRVIRVPPAGSARLPWMPGDESPDALYLGSIHYDVNKKSTQTISIEVHRKIPFQGVIFRILSNWGNEDYTCIYRVKVGGKPVYNNM